MSENANKKVSQALQHGEDCPALDELIELVARKDAQTEAHLAACPHCTTELALFREFQEPELRPEERADVSAIVDRLRQNSPVPQRTAWWKSFGSMKWLAPASMAMAAVLVGLFLWTPGGRTPMGGGPQVSGPDDAMRSARLTVVSPIGFVAAAPSKLEWMPVKGAVKYQVELRDVDQTKVWSGTVDSPSAALPAEVLTMIVPLKTFSWQVSAIDRSGAVVGESGAQRFRLGK